MRRMNGPSILLGTLFAIIAQRCSVVNLQTFDISPDFPFGASSTDLDGRIPGLVIDPFNKSVLYAAGEWTGIWKSTDGARTWRQSSNGLRNGITQEYAWPNLAIDANNPQRLLYATTSKDGRGFNCEGCSFGGLWISVDAAASWQHVN